MWYGSDRESGGKIVMLSVDKVKEILEINKKNQKIKKISDEAVSVPEPEEVGYKNVVGQESITRFDDKNKRTNPKRRKKRRQNKPKQGSNDQ